MTRPGFRRPTTAWRFLVDLVRAVTEPPVNVTRCDQRVSAAVADSAIARALSATADLWRRAASGSTIVAAYRRKVLPLVPARLADRVRAVACMAAAAAATTLILRTLSTEHDPLAWLLPAAVGGVAVIVVLGAESIANAIADRHS